MATEQQRERTQFAFQIDDGLNAEIEELVSRVPGLTKSIFARAALTEKAAEVRQKLDNGEKVAVTV